jgi:pimeloyl-ACP methyl ester carboxylesterase
VSSSLFHRELGDGPPLLLIHGIGLDSRCWDGIAGELAGTHRVVVYDRRGYGRSGGAAAGWHEHAEDAAALVGELGLAPVTVAAWSSGGIVALDLAAHHPDVVRRLVLAEPPMYGRRHMTPSLAGVFLRAQLERRLRGPGPALETFLRWVFRDRHGGSTWADLAEEWRAGVHANAEASWRDQDDGDGSHVPRERIRSLQIPIRCLLGDSTQAYFRKCTRALAQLAPGGSLVTVAGANHALPLQRPRALAAAIAEGEPGQAPA